MYKGGCGVWEYVRYTAMISQTIYPGEPKVLATLNLGFIYNLTDQSWFFVTVSLQTKQNVFEMQTLFTL